VTSLPTRHWAGGVPAGERKLAIVLPANNPSVNLCKVVASAVALGYPAPVIVNWKEETDVQTGDKTRSHLTKITGVLEYLQWATDSNTTKEARLGEDDLVLMLDAYDVWMQLPPSVLIQRYFAANVQADQRLATKSGSAFDDSFPHQTILVSSQKRCYAPRNSLSDLHCHELPISPLQDNIFGFFTDSVFTKYEYARPRYLNSGSFMGPAGDMRRYFQRVSDRMNEHLAKTPSPDELSGDQGIFAEIFGEQEVARREAMTNHPAENLRSRQTPDDSEFHLGLDYTQELFYPTCYSEHSGSFVQLSDPESIVQDSAQAGVAPPRLQSLPGDITLSPSPFAMLENSPARNQEWASVPLYADLWTSSIPVAIHHNAWRDGLKDRQRTWWDRTWYFPFLREMLDLRISANTSSDSTEPIARISAVENNHTLTVWPYQAWDVPHAALLFGASENGTLGLKGAKWSSVCQGRENEDEEQQPWYDEVFRDGKGSL
jgi:hypothetical protein